MKLALGVNALIFLSFLYTVSSEVSRDIQQKVEAAFLGGLIGDALALGGHHEHDVEKIHREVGKYTDFHPPGENNNDIRWGKDNHHPGKVKGDQTDAGDVAIWLLEVLASGQEYTFDTYALYWQNKFEVEGYGSCNKKTVGPGRTECKPGTTPGYINDATKRTLDNLHRNKQHSTGEGRKHHASRSNFFVSATHWMPLFAVFSDEEIVVNHCVDTVYLSHNSPDPLAASEFFARAMYQILYHGLDAYGAFDHAARKMNNAFITSKLSDAKKKVSEALDPESDLSKERFVDEVAITSLGREWHIGKLKPIMAGKAHPTDGALPATIYFILKYQNNLEEALVENASVGGDSASRGLMIGMILGAIHGDTAIPHRWMSGLRAKNHVDALFRTLQGRDEI